VVTGLSRLDKSWISCRLYYFFLQAFMN